MTSPSVLTMNRITPWVDGCCGPMLRVISSPAASARTMSLTSSCLLLRLVVADQQLERRRAARRHAAVLGGLAVVLAHRMADPVVRHQQAPQVRVPLVHHAEQIVLLALE